MIPPNDLINRDVKVTTKPCKNCFFFQETTPQCQHEKNREVPNYVDGYGYRPIYYNANPLRASKDHCGPEAKWFKIKSDTGDINA